MTKSTILRGPRAPLWFIVLLALLEALLWRWLVTSFDVMSGRGADAPDVQVAFWQLVLLVAGYVWQGIQIAGEITLKILAWSVKLLWAFAVAVNNAAIAVGKALVFLAKQAWVFLRDTYSQILRPAVEQFWNWFDRLRGWLDRTFGPVFRFLERIRKYVLDFYEKWVRPILDTIGIARKILGVLSSLGFEWARALDRKLRELEERIEAPFRFVIGKLNEIIGIVNRVVTADGLFQRIAYIRTLQRDVWFVWQGLFEKVDTKLTPEEQQRYGQTLKTKTRAEHYAELRSYIAHRDGPIAARVNEWIADVSIQARQTR